MAEYGANDPVQEGKSFQFLHIPKTGGSAIKHALGAYAGRTIELHGHKTRLRDIKLGYPVGFVIRDPVSRFVSAFYSRKRKGQPRYNSEWNPIECQVFEAFGTPRDLAEALGDADSPRHSLALQAMEGIGHFRKLGFWLGNAQALEARKEDIRFVGFQESLSEDFERLKDLVGLPASIELPYDDVFAHRNPAEVDESLSSVAVDAVKAWYQEDYELIEVLRAHSQHALLHNSILEVGMDKQTSPAGPVSEEQTSDQGHLTGESKNVITVLGSGRSGTSLLMQVLRELGMSTGGGEMLPASGSNPEGFLEDTEIVETHKTLLGELAMTPASPLPDNWLETSASRNAHKRLRQIMQQRVEHAGDRIWGFKDPRTTSFMPLWVRLFNQPGFKPRYLLTVRNPASVIASLREQVQRDDAVTEMLWLRRNIEALHNTVGNCFIVHYEDWFERPEEIVHGLLAYTGLNKTFQGDVGDVVKRVVQARLNRAPRQHQDVKVNNPYVIDLYESLRKCRGGDFDHAALMDNVERARRTMKSFDAGAARPNAALRSDQAAQNAANKNLDQLKKKHQKECEVLHDENSRLLRELTVATKNAESLRTQLTAQQQTHVQAGNTDKVRILKQKVSQLEQKLEAVRTSSSTRIKKRDQRIRRLQNNLKSIRLSYAYKVGWTIVSAIKKPGMNTVKAPFRLLKLSLMFLRGRRPT